MLQQCISYFWSPKPSLFGHKIVLIQNLITAYRGFSYNAIFGTLSNRPCYKNLSSKYFSTSPITSPKTVALEGNLRDERIPCIWFWTILDQPTHLRISEFSFTLNIILGRWYPNLGNLSTYVNEKPKDFDVKLPKA